MYDSDGGGGGSVRVEIIVYDVLCLLSIVSILVAFSKSRLKILLEEDALSRRLVSLCGFSLVYEFKFRLGQQISHFRLIREYGYTLVSISQLAHFVALIAATIDAVCWTTMSAHRARLRLRANAKTAQLISWTAWTVIICSSIATVCYVQFYRRQTSKIFFPKQLAELSSIPLAVLFFAVSIFWRSAVKKAPARHVDRATATVLSVYVRMIAVRFAINCSRIILIMAKIEWTAIHFIHALDGCFFALIAYKLEPLDMEVAIASETSINQLVNSGSVLQQV